MNEKLLKLLTPSVNAHYTARLSDPCANPAPELGCIDADHNDQLLITMERFELEEVNTPKEKPKYTDFDQGYSQNLQACRARQSFLDHLAEAPAMRRHVHSSVKTALPCTSCAARKKIQSGVFRINIGHHRRVNVGRQGRPSWNRKRPMNRSPRR